MRDWSNGKYRGLAVVRTREGYKVGEVSKRQGNQVQISRFADLLPTSHLTDAMTYLDDIRQSQIHRIV